METLAFWIILSRLADASVILFFSAVVITLLLINHKWLYVKRFFLAILGAGITVELLKVTTRVPRLPNGLIETSTYAFPSGHAATASVFYGLLGIWLTRFSGRKVYQYAGVALSLLIAYSRLALNVHTPFQVITGLLIGWLFVWGVYEMERQHT
ncbi:MAG: phosphatase PAP2 family protein [bacterium]|nr:phosphatase PAP2 family protein [bacterium]